MQNTSIVDLVTISERVGPYNYEVLRQWQRTRLWTAGKTKKYVGPNRGNFLTFSSCYNTERKASQHLVIHMASLRSIAMLPYELTPADSILSQS